MELKRKTFSPPQRKIKKKEINQKIIECLRQIEVDAKIVGRLEDRIMSLSGAHVVMNQHIEGMQKTIGALEHKIKLLTRVKKS